MTDDEKQKRIEALLLMNHLVKDELKYWAVRHPGSEYDERAKLARDMVNEQLAALTAPEPTDKRCHAKDPTRNDFLPRGE